MAITSQCFIQVFVHLICQKRHLFYGKSKKGKQDTSGNKKKCHPGTNNRSIFYIGNQSKGKTKQQITLGHF